MSRRARRGPYLQNSLAAAVGGSVLMWCPSYLRIENPYEL
jgi:hypothetical protein